MGRYTEQENDTAKNQRLALARSGPEGRSWLCPSTALFLFFRYFLRVGQRGGSLFARQQQAGGEWRQRHLGPRGGTGQERGACREAQSEEGELEVSRTVSTW